MLRCFVKTKVLGKPIAEMEIAVILWLWEEKLFFRRKRMVSERNF